MERIALHAAEKCQHGVEVGPLCSCRDHGRVKIVPCPPDCGVRMMDEQILADLPFENADQDRMVRSYRETAQGRFEGHDPYREL